MNKPSTVLLGGAICSALIVGARFANTYRLESIVRQLEAQCVEEAKRDISTPRWVSVCKAGELIKARELVKLESTTFSSEGTQAQIVAAQHNLRNSEDWPFALAAIVFIISAVPWGWYFLLRRIRELRDAIAGK